MRGILQKTVYLFIAFFFVTQTSHAAVHKVGPGETLTKPSDAAAIASNGDTVEIQAGTYKCDTGVRWEADNLTIRGVGGMAHLDAAGCSIPGGKAIWNPKGRNFSIENIEFSGASVPSKNGAGIRYEGSGTFEVKGSYFHDNENGILYTSQDQNGEIIIEHSEFAGNGFGDGQSHNFYINNAKSFTFRYNYTHSANIGHLIKTRARENNILYNRITGENGTNSYEIDISEGGLTYIIGNLIQQGPQSQNNGIISYAAEVANAGEQRLYVINNTIVNDGGNARLIRLGGQSLEEGIVQNNLLVGIDQSRIIDGSSNSVTLANNVLTDTPGFVNRAQFDYHLTASSPAVDAGADPGTGAGMALKPITHYLHQQRKEARATNNTLDVGAYEYIPAGSGSSSSSSGGTPIGGSSGGGGTNPTPCHEYTSSTAIPVGYGVPYDVLSATRTLLMTMLCDSTSATLNVGTGQQNQYIYEEGWKWADTEWEKFILTGTNKNTVWLVGNASYTLPMTAAKLSEDTNFVVAYLCTWTGTVWKCGCRDQACTTPSWQLQKFKQ